MKDKSIFLLDSMMMELDLPTYALGTELEKAVGGQAGIPYFKMLFSLPGMQDRILDMSVKIKACNVQYAADPTCSCVAELKAERQKIWDDVVSAGFLMNWDIMDNLWDKLPGD